MTKATRSSSLVVLALLAVGALALLWLWLWPRPSGVGFGGTNDSGQEAARPGRDDGTSGPSNQSDTAGGAPGVNEPGPGTARNPAGSESRPDDGAVPTWTSEPDPATLPIGRAKTVAKPKFEAEGRAGTSRVVWTVPELRDRPRGILPRMRRLTETRVVHGRVYEIRGTERIPLEGALVYDVSSVFRTFTDHDGRFEFGATASSKDGKGDDPEDPATGSFHKVTLNATAPGYDWARGHFYQRQIETVNGAELYLTPEENEIIEVRIANPELAKGDVTVAVAGGAGGIYLDERLLLSASVNDSGLARFSVPRRRFYPVSVTGKGVRAILGQYYPGKRLSETLIVFRVKLEPCENFWCTGTVTDLRSGRLIPGALIRTGDANEYTQADEYGRFGLWASRKPLDVHGRDGGRQKLCFEAYGFLGFSRDIEPAASHDAQRGLADTGPGGDETGPWRVAMRPLVELRGVLRYCGATGSDKDFVRPAVEYEDDSQVMPALIPLAADGSFVMERAPWGLREVKGGVGSGGSATYFTATIPPETWNSEGPYQAELTITGR